MPTITESISIAATPQTVFDLVSDPSRLPKWAPGVDATQVRVRASREHGTVDFFAQWGQWVVEQAAGQS